jgi:hypothetical protein
MVSDDVSDETERLVILSPDGSEHGAVENRVRFMDRDREGHWSWFEPPSNPSANVFGAVLQTLFDGDFLCDIDAATARILAVRRTR